ncbi:MAG: ABC transporter substrate-binding protein [Pseudomonadota bacterium]|nr:ABC transporter substrate-binding protein [Pseudomonadota bacterium]
MAQDRGRTTTLSVAIGDYPHTRALKSGEIASPMFALDFPVIKPVNRAFAPMARERRFDVSEMAIATVLQALAYGVEIALLPIVMASRFQEAALFVRADSPLTSPAELRGKRVGVRAYSQTTGLWLRGILQESFGVAPAEIAWTTFEGAHVEAYADPPFVQRAAAGKDLLTMLRAGEIDAAIVGADVPDDPGLRLLFADPQAAGEAFYARHGFIPINHMIVVKRELAAAPGVASELCRLFAAAKAGAPVSGRDRAPIGLGAVAPCVRLAAEYALAQGLLPRRLAEDEIWRYCPEEWR